MTHYAIIGGGNIGEALVSGLVSHGVDGKRVRVADHNSERLDHLRERYGVVTTDNAHEATEEAQYLFICVKPDGVVDLLEDLASTVDNNAEETTIVSVAAGISTTAMEAVLPAGTPVVRVMPNTPMLVGKGMSAVAPGRFAERAHVDAVAEIMGKTGRAVVVKEKDIDAVTAISGSGPAYFFLVTEAMIDAGVNLGLPRAVAEELAIATADGAAAMMAQRLDADSGDAADDPVTLRAKVSSPGGTTSAATRTLDENGLRTAFYRAMEACARRSRELGE